MGYMTIKYIAQLWVFLVDFYFIELSHAISEQRGSAQN